MNLAAQVALVIGGATGIMAPISVELGRLGATVAIHYHQSKKAARTLLRGMGASNRPAQLFSADLTQPDAASRLAEEVCEAMGPPTLLVYGASPFERVGVTDADAPAWQRALGLEVQAPALLISALRARGALASGQIILMGDLSGEQGWPPFGPHSVAKAGALALARLLAVELAPEVRVNVLSLGAMADDGGGPVHKVPLARGAQVDDVLRGLRYLLEADYVTGEILHVDGGRLARRV